MNKKTIFIDLFSSKVQLTKTSQQDTISPKQSTSTRIKRTLTRIGVHQHKMKKLPAELTVAITCHLSLNDRLVCSRVKVA